MTHYQSFQWHCHCTKVRIEKYCALKYDNEITLLIGKLYTCMIIAEVTNYWDTLFLLLPFYRLYLSLHNSVLDNEKLLHEKHHYQTMKLNYWICDQQSYINLDYIDKISATLLITIS